MRFLPPREKNLGLIFSAACLFSAAAAFALSAADGFPRALMQLVSVVLLVISIQLMQRYVLTSFEYELLPRDLNGGEAVGDSDNNGADNTDYIDAASGITDFSVIKLQGERRKTVCSLSCAGLKAVYKDNKTERAKAKAEFGEPDYVYNYHRNLFPAEPVVCLFEFNGKLADIRIEADDRFRSELISRIG